MNLIYIHGLDSDANSTKGVLLEKYCQLHHPDINVLRPDLNKTPAQVCEQLLSLIKFGLRGFQYISVLVCVRY